MMADYAALFALKTFLQEHGVEVCRIGVYFLDSLGQPAHGPANFEPILESLGYASYTAQSKQSVVRAASSRCSCCSPHVPAVYAYRLGAEQAVLASVRLMNAMHNDADKCMQ
jgi:hypothetical protein